MRVLMISTDAKIFEPSAPVRNRMIGYADAYRYLFICVIGQGNFLPEQINKKLQVISRSRISAFFLHPGDKFDLITSQDPFENGLIAWFLAKRLKARLELQIHTDLFSPYFIKSSWLNHIRLMIAKFLLPKADQIRVVSQRIADSLQPTTYKLQANIVIRPIFFDTKRIKTAPVRTDLHQKYPQFPKIILMASRLTKEKNISLAIEAMREVTKTNPEIGLIIVGSGPEENSLKFKVQSLKLESNVFFETWVDMETLFSYYKTCDLFLLTSWYEGYGMTLVEAQAAECKIISTDVGVAREVGANIISYNPSDLASKILSTI